MHDTLSHTSPPPLCTIFCHRKMRKETQKNKWKHKIHPKAVTSLDGIHFEEVSVSAIMEQKPALSEFRGDHNHDEVVLGLHTSRADAGGLQAQVGELGLGPLRGAAVARHAVALPAVVGPAEEGEVDVGGGAPC